MRHIYKYSHKLLSRHFSACLL